MTKHSVAKISNRVDELGKSMDDFEQRLDKILSTHKQEASVSPLSVVLEELQTDFSSFKKEASESLSSLKKEIDELKGQVFDTSMQLDELNQYSRRNCILIHGISQTPNEDVDSIALKIFNDNLKLQDIGLSHLDRCHRIGSPKRSTDIVRQGKLPIIVKFTSYRIRSQVWKAKRLLKNSGILITESLTPYRQKLLRSAKDRFGSRSAYSQDGRVILWHNNRRITVTSEEDLRSIT